MVDRRWTGLHRRRIQVVKVNIADIHKPGVRGIHVLDRDRLGRLRQDGVAAAAPHDVVVEHQLAGMLVRQQDGGRRR